MHIRMNLPISTRHIELWILKFACFLSGCWLCFVLQSHFHFSSVLAAAFIGFAGTFLPETRRIDHWHVQATIYTGAFVAMGSKLNQTEHWQLLMVSAIGTTLYFILDRHFKGLGGKLGLIAFISTLLSLLLRNLA